MSKLNVKTMSKESILRWNALIETVSVIDEFCERKNIKFNDLNLKPRAMQDYVSQLYNQLEYDYRNEQD